MTQTLFYDIQFPTDIAYGAVGGPEFFTDIITSSSGFEQRNINWLKARHRYNLAPAIKSKEQLEYLLKFFYLSMGKAIGFRFKDWSDYQLLKQKIAVGDGKAKEFQLIKTYNYLDYQTIRKISKPVLNTVKVYSNGQLVNPRIDHQSGLIIFVEAPIKDIIIEAEAEFDVPVRFDTDYLATSIENYAVYSHHEIALVEIKL